MSTLRHRCKVFVIATLHKASIDKPDETRPFCAHDHMDVVTIGDFTLGRGTFEPRWRWSTDVKPIAGTDSCMTRHTCVIVSGTMTVHSDDGSEVTYGPNDVFVMEPERDAWTVGDAPCVVLDTGVKIYAKPAQRRPGHGPARPGAGTRSPLGQRRPQCVDDSAVGSPTGGVAESTHMLPAGPRRGAAVPFAPPRPAGSAGAHPRRVGPALPAGALRLAGPRRRGRRRGGASRRPRRRG